MLATGNVSFLATTTKQEASGAHKESRTYNLDVPSITNAPRGADLQTHPPQMCDNESQKYDNSTEMETDGFQTVAGKRRRNNNSSDEESHPTKRDPHRFDKKQPPKTMKLHTIRFKLAHYMSPLAFAKRLKEQFPNIRYKNLSIGKKPRELFLTPLDTYTFLALTNEKVKGKIFGDTEYEVLFTKTDRKELYSQKLEKHLNTVVLLGIQEPTTELTDALHSIGIEVTAARAIMHQDGSPAGRIWVQLQNREKAQRLITEGVIPLYGLNIKVSPYELGPRPRRCNLCQSFEHKASDCHNVSKCSKCTLQHLTKDCPQRGNRELALKCANCGQAHKTNAAFCHLYLEKKQQITYAQIAKGRKPIKKAPPKPKEVTPTNRPKPTQEVKNHTPSPSGGNFPELQEVITPKGDMVLPPPKPKRERKPRRKQNKTQKMENNGSDSEDTEIEPTPPSNTIQDTGNVAKPIVDLEQMINNKITEQMVQLKKDMQQKMAALERKMEQQLQHTIGVVTESVQGQLTAQFSSLSETLNCQMEHKMLQLMNSQTQTLQSSILQVVRSELNRAHGDAKHTHVK